MCETTSTDYIIRPPIYLLSTCFIFIVASHFLLKPTKKINKNVFSQTTNVFRFFQELMWSQVCLVKSQYLPLVGGEQDIGEDDPQAGPPYPKQTFRMNCTYNIKYYYHYRRHDNIHTKKLVMCIMLEV